MGPGWVLDVRRSRLADDTACAYDFGWHDFHASGHGTFNGAQGPGWSGPWHQETAEWLLLTKKVIRNLGLRFWTHNLGYLMP